MHRRQFLQLTAASLAATSAAHARRDRPLRIGITDWNLNLTADPAAIPLAKRLSFDGIQVSCGRKIADGRMPLDNAELIAKYVALSRENEIPIDGTCLDRLHDNGLKSDKLAPKWVVDAIRITRQIGTKVILVPFFGRWALETQAEKDYTADALRELAPEAEKAGVILGIENTISARDNMRILDKVASKHVLVYYDVGNSTKAGFDPVQEIRLLGKSRICQFHFKDDPHLLGEGAIEFRPILHTIRDMGYDGYINLETNVPTGDLEAGLRRNLIYIRDLMPSA